ncbi:N-acetyl sugar amidotransferase [Rhodobacteraceae bacterium nBUS_24]
MFTQLDYLKPLSLSAAEKNMDFSPLDISEKYNLPLKVKFCKCCVMSNQRPRIVFDENGICSACLYWKRKNSEINWSVREQELWEVCEKHRSKDGSFDVLVPSSGGKDSVYVAHLLRDKYGMNPLTMTWAPHLYSEIGYRNFQAKVHAGFNNISLYPNGVTHRRMSRISAIEIGDPFQPFIYGQTYLPLKVADFYGIQLIFDGENGEAEYGGDPESENKSGFSLDDARDYWLSGFPIEKWKAYGFSSKELQMYLPPKAEKLCEIERYFASYFLKWEPQRHYFHAVKNTNFKASTNKRSEGTYSRYSSLDDLIDPFHYFFSLTKFGLGRCTSDAAHEIREGVLDREEAIALVNKYDREFPSEKSKQIFQKYCCFNDDELRALITKWTNKNLWDGIPNYGGVLKAPVN